MLGITENEIASLNDGDLRDLVALLCEAELRRSGLSVAAVTAGGNQDAADGGLDVRVSLPVGTKINGFVPRPETGFQVKKPDMPRGEILDEMRPKDKLRRVIQDLALKGGAYIIVSSTGSTSDKALVDRRKAMADAVEGAENAKGLALDFYDRTRIASWVREHPGLTPWIREKIGRRIAGWQSFGPWANPAEGTDAEFLIDEKTRVRTARKEDEGGLPALQAIGQVREILSKPAMVARLVGLSGVGKTRFVQALFDARVGENALDPSTVLYTNLSDAPDPQPIGMVSDLIAAQTNAIVIVDNCPADLHGRLSEVCRSRNSTVSVLTVEYDIRDDQPEGTEVFEIEPSSVELIEKLIRQRFPNVSQVDARTVAEFSGGNARIAVALASTVNKGDTLSALPDEELFKRLFQQRQGTNEPLLLAAQACALLYSFQGEAISGDDAELPIIAGLIGISSEELYRAVAELKRRELVQQRGNWRAVLPHAIANRLAMMALQNIPVASVEGRLAIEASERARKSFSRRLGYLHDSLEAVKLVESWLAPGGRLGDLSEFDGPGIELLLNIAPVSPGAVLAAIERAPVQSLANQSDYVRLLRSLAYEPALFERAANLLAAFAEAEEPSEGNAASAFASLFSLFLSGTHATVEQRIGVLERQLRSENESRQKAGLEALDAMLEAWHFTSAHSFDFGARSRDHGSWPRTQNDVEAWFSPVLKLVEDLACSDLPIAAEIRNRVASKFRGIWKMAHAYDDLERVSLAIAKTGFWREGWIGVRRTLQFDAKDMGAETNARLEALERALRPRDLVQRVRAIVLGRPGGPLDYDDFAIEDDGKPKSRWEHAAAVAAALGKEAAKDGKALAQLLPELMVGQGQQWKFGEGLAIATDRLDVQWKELKAQFKVTPENSRNSQILRGYVSGANERNAGDANRLLDDALGDPILSAYMPDLQVAVPVDESGLARLHHALDFAPARRYRVLAWGRASDPIPGRELRLLLSAIAAKPDGHDVGVEILYMRVFADRREKKPVDPELVEAGRDLLLHLPSMHSRNDDDHKLAELASYSLGGNDGGGPAREIFENLRKAVAARTASAYGYRDLIYALFAKQSLEMLDAVFSGDEDDRKSGRRIIEEVSDNGTNPLNALAEATLVQWCQQAPNERYPAIAGAITLTQPVSEPEPMRWNDSALVILAKAPDNVAVMKQFLPRLYPRSWSGSHASAIERFLPLLQYLEQHSDLAVADFAREARQMLRREVDDKRRRETEADKLTDERFE
jgi:hypothetical protein